MIGRVLFATLALATTSSVALADGEGGACETSADCGALHCIDGVCAAVVNGHPVFAEQPATAGERAMFGDGHGYATTILVADVLASATAAVFVGLAGGTTNGVFAVVALFPTTLTSPIIHAANGRGVPAVIALLGWASIPPSAVFLALVSGFATNNETTAWAIGTGVSLAGAIGMTALDVYMARQVRLGPTGPSSASGASWAPAVVPLRGGAEASIVGTF